MSQTTTKEEIRTIMYGAPPRRTILQEISLERDRQDSLHGKDRDQQPYEWLMILGEEVGEANKGALDVYFMNLAGKIENKVVPFALQNYREELIQVAAVAVAAIECLDRQRKNV